MKVSELIEQLQSYDQYARIVVSGYEDGYDDVTVIKEIFIKPCTDPKWYYGRYEKAHPETIEQSERAILLFGKDRSER
jgi:hypothetical protein